MKKSLYWIFKYLVSDARDIPDVALL